MLGVFLCVCQRHPSADVFRLEFKIVLSGSISLIVFGGVAPLLAVAVALGFANCP